MSKLQIFLNIYYRVLIMKLGYHVYLATSSFITAEVCNKDTNASKS